MENDERFPYYAILAIQAQLQGSRQRLVSLYKLYFICYKIVDIGPLRRSYDEIVF